MRAVEEGTEVLCLDLRSQAAVCDSDKSNVDLGSIGSGSLVKYRRSAGDINL